MACAGGGGGGCQSHCLRQPEEEAEVAAEAVGEERDGVERLSISGARFSSDGDRALCSKCGVEAVACNNLCAGCFRASLFGKFKLAVTSHGMISPTDKVLVAFSGGPASRVALQFVHEMQLKAQKSWDASKDQSLPVFGVGVAFIVESVVSCRAPGEVDRAIEEIRLIVSQLAPPSKELHIASIENIFSLNSKDGTTRLNELLSTVSDLTGKEDLLHHLRMISLQKIALDNGFNKLVLGSCTTGIACHIICATVKGQGYSLPADVQYVDARWEVPVVLPLRDCLAQDLTMLCQLDGLKTQLLLDQLLLGINSLVSSFVARLQEENPSRARTIVRTAEKLRPFCFNRLVDNDSDNLLPSRIRRKLQNIRTSASTPLEVLCPICGAPLSESDLLSLKKNLGKLPTRHDVFAAHCCQSCCSQILPKEAASLEHFYSLLPQLMAGRMKNGMNADQTWLREQIKDCLLSDDDEDGT